MDDEVSGPSVESLYRACSELLKIRLAALAPSERAGVLLGLNARILEFSAYEIALVRDPGSAAHLIRMAAELDRMNAGRTVVAMPDLRQP